jgi:hypothetical protein
LLIIDPGAPLKWGVFAGQFGADKNEFALNVDAGELPLIHSDGYLNDLLLNIANRRWPTEELI